MPASPILVKGMGPSGGKTSFMLTKGYGPLSVLAQVAIVFLQVRGRIGTMLQVRGKVD